MALQLEAQHGVLHLLRAPERLVVVDLPRRGDHPALHREVRRDEVGVHRDAMTAHAAARPQDVHPGVLVGQPDQLPHVDPRLVADERQLVGEGDLHVAARVLRQLAHLRRLAIRAVQGPLNEPAIELDRLRGRRLVDAADHPVVVRQLVDHVPRQHPLRAVGDVDLIPQLRALREDQVAHLVGRADRRGRLDHVQVPLFQAGEHRPGSRLHVGDVRLVVPLERRGDDHEIGVAHLRRGRGAQVAVRHHLAQHLLHPRLDDVQTALVGHLHHSRVDIHARHLYAVLGGDNSRGQADIAQPHETCFHF